ncbi:hypothetical protein DUNSADRAFT_315 [Dunaliella salina]|uniref:Encoded protein n=1 Tax=Dunaliella salina TaxID=3046 RepID=A0ABQ7FZ73_DUNSA|nr:hypothetical protein DUNSADRAFT_315 [Dunaliella salina]|eukprot:KAF5827651.1 hypothetical protein DUNSADRAFT_315 [Dunaliella salina]
MRRRQHRKLSKQLRGAKITLHSILLDVDGTIYTAPTIDKFKKLGIDYQRPTKLAGQLHAYSVQFAHKLTSTRRAIEVMHKKPSLVPWSRELTETHQGSLEHCFKFADINFRSIPVGHKDHPVYPHRYSLAHNNQSSTDQRRRLLGSYLLNGRKSFPGLSFNYNDQKNGAEMPAIPIWTGGGDLDFEIGIFCKDCFLSLTPGISFAMKINAGLSWTGPYVEFDYLEVAIDGQLVFSLGLQLKAFAEKNLFDTDRSTLLESPAFTVDFSFTGIPVWIDISGRLDVSSRLDLVSELSLTAGILYQAGIKWGVRYSPTRGFQEIQEGNQKYTPTLLFDAETKLELGVTFYPDLIVSLWSTIPIALGPQVSIYLDIGFGIKVWHAESKEQRDCTSLGYQLSYKIGFGLGVEPITIPIPIPLVPDFTVTEEAYRTSFDIIDKSPFPFDSASDCWELGEKPDFFGFWRTGSWSTCSEPCGEEGVISRTVQCFNADDEEVEESQLNDQETLLWSGIKSRCTWDLLYNGECDEDCNTEL